MHLEERLRNERLSDKSRSCKCCMSLTLDCDSVRKPGEERELSLAQHSALESIHEAALAMSASFGYVRPSIGRAARAA